MLPTARVPDATTVSRFLAAVAVLVTVLAAVAFLLPRPLADAFFAGWVLFSVGLALLGAVAAWTRRRPLLWLAALAMTGLSVVGMWSIGAAIAPAALSLLVSAGLLEWVAPRPPGRPANSRARHSPRASLAKALGGAGAGVLGGWLLYQGTVVRELFARGCARETLACALAVTRWDAVGLSAVGLAAIGVGGWLVWRQLAVDRVVAANQSG